MVVDRPQQRAAHEEPLRVQLVLHHLPAARLDRPQVQELAGVVPLVDGLRRVDALVALQPDQLAAGPAREHLGHLGLADPGLTLEQERPLQRERQEDRTSRGRRRGGIRVASSASRTSSTVVTISRIVPAGAGALAADRGTLGPRIGADGVPVLPHRDRVRVAHAGVEGSSLDDLVADVPRGRRARSGRMRFSTRSFQSRGSTRQRGASIAACGSAPSSTICVSSWAWTCACASPPMEPNTRLGVPSRRTIAGISVCIGRFDGPSTLTRLSSSVNDEPRLLRLIPHSGTCTPDPKPRKFDWMRLTSRPSPSAAQR